MIFDLFVDFPLFSFPFLLLFYLSSFSFSPRTPCLFLPVSPWPTAGVLFFFPTHHTNDVQIHSFLQGFVFCFFVFVCLRHKTFSREQAARRSCVGNAARTTASLLVTRSCATCSVSLQRGFSFVGVAAVVLFFFWRVRRIFFNQKNLLRWSGQSTALRESITDLLAASCRVCACSAQR